MNEITLKQERARYVAFAFASADLLVELDTAGNICYIDGATLGLMGRKPDMLVGAPFVDFVAEPDRPRFQQILEGLPTLHRVEGLPLRLEMPGGEMLEIQLSGFHTGLGSGHLYFSLRVPHEQTPPEEIFRRDFRSGLLRKEIFVSEASQRILEAKKSGQEMNVTLLDFPELTALLDALGEERAARLLEEISAYLRSQSLGGDTAGAIGNGQYSLVHGPSLDTKEIVSRLMEITRRADPSGQGARPRAATLDTKIPDLTAQDTANALLYTIHKFAREQGDAFNIASLSETYEEMLVDTIEKIETFKGVVENAKFEIAFQPIVDIKTSIIHHYECLVRLKDGETFATPMHFIAFGEQAGVIGDFDLAMLEKAIAALESAASEGNYPNVAVNISGKSLSSKMFTDIFSRVLEGQPKLRKQIIVEITESSRIHDMAGANDFIQRMRNRGNAFCLDDFGSGESSFDYLRNLQVDYIKIDGSYILESVKTARGRQMLRALATLCNNMGVITIGEMVEDERAAALLFECGIKFGQGHLFGLPDTNRAVLARCSTPSKNYAGMMKAKKFQP